MGRADDPRRWDLTDIYPSEEEWERDRAALLDRARRLDAWRGRLAEGAEVLASVLDEQSEIHRLAQRLHTYASLASDEDLREPGPRAMEQRIEANLSELATLTSWIEPELLQLPPEQVRRMLDGSDALKVHQRYIERIEKRRDHTLDADGERLLGMARLIRGDGEKISGLLRDAEIPWPTIRLSTGEEVRLDPTGYSRTRNSRVRADRVSVFHAFHATLQEFKESLSAGVYGTVKEHVFEARARSYPTSRDAALAGTEVPAAVMDTLFAEVRSALPLLHRYLQTRGRLLGVDDLAYHDLYPPLVDEVKADYGWDAAREVVLEALSPLGEDYVTRARTALRSRWIDVDPRRGKRSGAYVNDGAYGAHPYMLLNHTENFHGVSTIAHELGHLMHSWYSQEAQPYPTARYTIFVAEVASTLNEILLLRHLIGGAEAPEQRLALLGHHLENIRGTVFRQTMFAEFESQLHEVVEAGDALTGQEMNERYGALLRRYHGHDGGVMRIDERYDAEWGFVPHFHYDFYVYQYATSFVAATALSQRILDGETGARERYLGFLRTGSTKPPVDLLRDAGVDMTAPDPIRATMDEMRGVLDAIDELTPARTAGGAGGSV
jgi:oligoendopeptidase F